MSEWRTFELSASSWAPSDYLRSVLQLASDHPLTPLRDVVEPVATMDRYDESARVVSPSNVSRAGVVVSARGSSGDDGARLGEALKERDVLVPCRGDGPCVFVSPAHANLTFSGFIALRPVNIEAVLLWGLLTASRGAAMRVRLHSGAIVPRLRVTDLLGCEVSTLGARHPLLQRLAESLPQQPVRLVTAPVRESVWGIRELRGGANWSAALARLGNEHLRYRLGDFADVHAGRESTQCWPVPKDGLLPVADGRWAAGGSPTRWATPGGSTRVGQGTIIVSRIGARARVCDGEMCLSRTALALELHVHGRESDRSELARQLAGYLNSQAGRSVARQYFSSVSGDTTLSPRLLRDLPVPDPETIREFEASSPEQSIAERLEAILWPT